MNASRIRSLRIATALGVASYVPIAISIAQFVPTTELRVITRNLGMANSPWAAALPLSFLVTYYLLLDALLPEDVSWLHACRQRIRTLSQQDWLRQEWPLRAGAVLTAALIVQTVLDLAS